MSLHDQYARITPFELAFPDPGAVDDLVRRVAAEAAGRGADPGDPSQFVTMGAVADTVRDLVGDDAPPGSTHTFGSFVYQAVHFAEAGRPLYLLSAHAARYLVEGVPGGTPRAPDRGGYLQLPQHLFWASADEGAEHESVDGIAWTTTEPGVLHALLVTGMRADRPGLAVMPLPAAPLADAATWIRAEVREEARGAGADFSSDLPGADLDGLYAFRAAGEVLKLLGRFFAHIDATPSAVGEVRGLEDLPAAGDEDAEAGRAARGEPGAGEATAAGPRPSDLTYRRVGLGA